MRSPLTLLLVGLLKAYRFAISPLYGQVCRYHPSCSAYALEAVTVHGGVKGSWLTARRLVRCNPWSAGGYDPVPPRRGSQPAVSVEEDVDLTLSDQQPLGLAQPTQGV